MQEAEVLAGPASYDDFSEPPANFSSPIYDDEVKILSFANKTEEEFASILSTVAVIQLQTQLMLLLVWITAGLLYAIIDHGIPRNSRLYCRKTRKFQTFHEKDTEIRLATGMFMILKAMLNQGLNFSQTSKQRILSLSVNLFVFLFLVNYLPYITTDLVIETKAFRIDSLEDLYEPEAAHIRPIFRGYGQIASMMEHLPTEKSKRLYKHIQKFGIDNCRFSFDKKVLFYNIERLSTHPFALIMGEKFLKIFMRSFYSPILATKRGSITDLRLHTSKNAVFNAVYSYLHNLEDDRHNGKKLRAFSRR